MKQAETKYNKDGSIQRIIEFSNGDFAVDLFPYKIKNRELFYDRDHPENIAPESFEYEAYWEQRLRNYLEGRWVYDEGTWVFMPPKLDFYINYVPIVDENRRKIMPRLRDNEWIMSYYGLCAEGFSGFELDEEYTCNELVQKWEEFKKDDKKELKGYELSQLESSPHVKTKTGEYKKYINAWDYLTEHYLLTHKKDFPLGKALYENNKSDEMTLASRAAGKAIKPDELVLSKKGWVKIKDLKVGDKVYGSDGKLCDVIAKTDIQKDLEMYKITLRDGREIDACKDHLWKVWDKRKNRIDKNIYSVLSTEEMYKDYFYTRIDSAHRRRHGEIRMVPESKLFLPLNKCVDYEEAELPIDPYLLGLWIGDGSSHRVEITTADKEIVDYCYKIAEEYGHNVTINTKKNNKASSYHITKGRKVKKEDKTLLNIFKNLNLINNKHIPRLYLESSRRQRLELLRGLMDSDGTANGRDVSFTNSNRTVIDNMIELVRSLGMYASVSEKQAKLYGVSKKMSFRIFLKTNEKVFNLERKHAAHLLDQPKGVFGTGRFEKVAIVGIQKIDNHDGICIAVDNEDHTYITKDFIVTHNSFFNFGGNFLHEWLTNGAKNLNDFKKYGSNQKLFGAGAVKADQLDRSLSIIKRMYNDMPGSYTYGVDDKGKEDKVNGFMYKRTIGSWESGSKVEHKVENINNTIDISGNILQAPVLTPDNFKIFAGDRFAMILIEEVGFVPFLKKLRNAFRDSLGVGKKKIGKAIYTGTGGSFDDIQDAKEMFENPEAFSIYGIPNYFDKNRQGTIGLFLSACLKAEEFKDSNGNTIYEDALLDVIEQREVEYEKSDSTTFWEYIAYNPLYPKEMLRPSSKSVLPVVEMSEHRGTLIVTDKWKNRASIGSFKWDMNEVSKVGFRRDLDNSFYIINDWGKDKELHNREGGWVMYEDVMPQRPDHLYYILYDPAAHSGEGTSLHSGLVYKHKFTGGNQSMQETFVAEFIGRKPTLEQNFEEIIRAALYYNAQIMPEVNTPGFVEWAERKGWGHLIMYEPQRFLSEVRRTPQKFTHRKGIRVDDVINKWSLTRFGDWLRQPVMVDEDGVPLKFRFQNIFSLRLLDEGINFVLDNKTEYDHMSSALLLMPLLLEIEEDYVELLDEFADPLQNKYSKYSVLDYKPKGRSRFINY